MKKILKYIRKYIVLGALLALILLYSVVPAFAYTEVIPGDYVLSPFNGLYLYSNQALTPIQISIFNDVGAISFESGFSSNNSFEVSSSGVISTNYNNAIVNYYVDQSYSNPIGFSTTYSWNRGFISDRHYLEYIPVLMAGNSFESSGYNFYSLEQYLIDNNNFALDSPNSVTLQNPGVMYLHTDMFSDVDSFYSGNVDTLGGVILNGLSDPSGAHAGDTVRVVYSFDLQRPGFSDVHIRGVDDYRLGDNSTFTDDDTLWSDAYSSFLFAALDLDWLDTYLRDEVNNESYSGPFSIQNLSVQYVDLPQLDLSTYRITVLQNYACYTDPSVDRYSDINEGAGKFFNSNVYEDLFLLMSIDDDGSFGDGYNSGYRDGHNVGYTEGYDNGSAVGYTAGYEEGLSQVDPDLVAEFQKGYNQGYDAGFYNRIKGLDFTNFIGTAVSGFLDFELIPGVVSLSGILACCLAMALMTLFMKYFAGG